MKKKKAFDRLEALSIGHPVPQRQLKGIKTGDEVEADVDGRKVMIGKITAMYRGFDNDLGFDSCDIKINMDDSESIPLNALAAMSAELAKSKRKKVQIDLKIGAKKAVGIVKTFNSKKWLTSQTVKIYFKKVE